MDWLKTNGISILALFFAGTAAYASLTNRISVLEADTFAQKENGSKLERRIDRQLDRVENKIDDIAARIDRAFER